MDRQPLPLPEIARSAPRRRRAAFGAILAGAVWVAVAAGPALAGPEEEAIRRSDALEAENRPQEALAVLQEADRRSPRQADILFRLAKHYDRLSRQAAPGTADRLLAASHDAATRAVEADPANAQARLALAIASGRLARKESPRRQIELSRLIQSEAEEAVRLDPDNDIAWHVLARWNFEMATINPVLRKLAQAIYGKLPAASTARAEFCFRQAIAVGPPRVMHHVEYGLMLAALGRKKDARKQLEIGINLPPKDQEDEESQKRARQALDRLR